MVQSPKHFNKRGIMCIVHYHILKKITQTCMYISFVGTKSLRRIYMQPVMLFPTGKRTGMGKEWNCPRKEIYYSIHYYGL